MKPYSKQLPSKPKLKSLLPIQKNTNQEIKSMKTSDPTSHIELLVEEIQNNKNFFVEGVKNAFQKDKKNDYQKEVEQNYKKEIVSKSTKKNLEEPVQINQIKKTFVTSNKTNEEISLPQSNKEALDENNLDNIPINPGTKASSYEEMIAYVESKEKARESQNNDIEEIKKMI